MDGLEVYTIMKDESTNCHLCCNLILPRMSWSMRQSWDAIHMVATTFEAAMDNSVAVGDFGDLAVKHLCGTANGTPVGADDGTSDGILYGLWTRLCAGTVLDATENAARLLQCSGFISG